MEDHPVPPRPEELESGEQAPPPAHDDDAYEVVLSAEAPEDAKAEGGGTNEETFDATELVELFEDGDGDQDGDEEERSEGADVHEEGDAAEHAAQPLPSGPDATQREEIAFYRDEARSLSKGQIERSALMWLEASQVAQQSEAEDQEVLADIEHALEARPDAAWLLDRARRLLMRMGRYDHVLKIGQREVKLGGENAHRTAVLFECAAVMRYHLGRHEVALQLLRRALQLDGHYVPALAAVASIAQEKKLFEEAAEALEHLGDCLTDPGQRALALYRAGTIRELCLDQQDQGQALYLRAVETDPQNVLAASVLCETYRATEQWPQLCRAIEHLATLVQESDLRAKLLLEAGTLHLDRTGDLAAAAHDLAGASREAPKDMVALRRLAQAYDLEGRHRETINTLRQLEELTADSRGRAAVLTRIGNLHVTLQELDEAADAYRQALARVPGYLPAVQELGTLCRKRSDHEGLIAIATIENESLLPAGVRAMRYVELAGILEHQLDRPREALDAYGRAIDLLPTLHLAYWRLAALLERLGSYEQLVALKTRHCEICKDGRTRAQLMLSRARVQATALSSPTDAITSLKEASELPPPRTVSLELLELYESTGSTEEQVALLLELAEQTSDSNEAENYRLEAAILLNEELDQHERALALLSEVLKENPQSQAAIHLSGRILHRRGAWEDLVKLYHHELSNDPKRADATLLLARMAQIIERHLGNRPTAINAYTRALRVDPTYRPAISAIEALCRAEGRWPELVEVLVRSASAFDDAHRASQMLVRAAEINCWQLSKHEEAQKLFHLALEKDGSSLGARQGLARVAVRMQRWAEAAQALEELIEASDSDEERALLRLELARIKEHRLDEDPALTLYQQAAGAPFGAQLREEVARAWRQQHSPHLAEVMTELGRATNDDALAAAHLLDAAYQVEIGKQEGERLVALEMAYERRRGDLPVSWALERALIHNEHWSDLAELMEKHAHMELDRSMRVQLLSITAAAYHRGKRIEDAERICRESLNFDAHCLPALRILMHIADDRQHWAQLAEAYDRLAEACDAPENRLRCCLQAAEIWSERVLDTTHARASLAVALADNPDQEQAFSRAEELLRKREEFEELSRLYYRRIRTTPHTSTKIDLLWRHAKMLRDDLEQPDAAITELNELLRLAPDNVPSLRALADLHRQRGHWSGVATALQTLLERSTSGEIQQEARLQLASLWLDHIHEPNRARDMIVAAEAAGGAEDELARLRIKLAAATGDWAGAREILERMLDEVSGSDRTWALLQLADVASLGLRDDELAQRCLADAIKHATGEADGIETLRAHYPGRLDRRRLVDGAERLLQQGGDEPTLLAVRELVARVWIDDLEDPARALPHLEELQHQTRSPQLTLLHARALASGGEREQAVELCRQVLANDAGATAAYRAIVRAASGEVAAAAASIVDLLGGELDVEESLSLRTLEGTLRSRGDAPASLVGPRPEDGDLEEMLELLAPTLVDFFPRPPGHRLDSEHPAFGAALNIARPLGLELGSIETVDGSGASLALGDSISLRLGSALTEQHQEPIFRFWVARALAGGSRGAVVVQQLNGDEIGLLLAALSQKRPGDEEAARLRKHVLSQLPRKQRKQLESFAWDGQELARYHAFRRGQADTVALLLTRQPGSALRLLGQETDTPPSRLASEPRFAELMRFAVSEAYGTASRTVWG